MDAFSELCLKYHTPKVRELAAEGMLAHDYAATYNAAFARRSIQKILEIGCGYKGLFHREYMSGGSLFMWAELFPDAAIFGLDVRADALVNEGRIRSFLCDQSSVEQLLAAAQQVGTGVDLVVDDGSHKWHDQVETARIFAPLLSPRGTYIIEDVLPGGECSAQLPFPHELVLCSQLAAGIIDDRLIVIRQENL